MVIHNLLPALFAFLALVNPIQKILVMFSLQENYTVLEQRKIVKKATVTSLFVLLGFFFLGETVLKYVFNLEIYSFQITCGVVLFYNGFMALQKGTFISIDKKTRLEDIIAVPIAIPMIAGPATITAVVTMPTIYGRLATVIAVVVAILVNMVVMLYAHKIGKTLVRYNILLPLIRIIGLIVAAIGVQMILSGISEFGKIAFT